MRNGAIVPDLRQRLRAGLRPAVYVAVLCVALGVFSLPMFPAYTVTPLEIGTAGILMFGLVLSAYASGLVRPADRSRRIPVNLSLLAIAGVALALAAATQCPGD